MRARDIVTGRDIGHNDDLDAFRHAYAMSKVAIYSPDFVPQMVGILHENSENNDPEERDMDLWNNYIGIKLAAIASSPDELGSLLKTALENGSLITSPRSISEEERSQVTSVFTDILNNILSDASTISSTLLSSYQSFAGAVSDAIPPKDPLIIDMNNDGLALSSWQNSGVRFDLDGNGAVESTGWTLPSTASSDSSTSEEGIIASSYTNDDVFLVLDKNGNGEIDDISELFGNSSNTGFEELRAYDSNADNLINSSDSQFNLLNLWNDANANGVVDVITDPTSGIATSELTSLSEANVESISLRSLYSSKLISGNLINQTAAIKFTDGDVGSVNEVFFATNSFNSSISNPDEALGPDFTLNIDTLLLPYSRGYGNLNSWQVAMSLNDDLLETATELKNLKPENFYKINSLFETFLFQLAGVENVTI